MTISAVPKVQSQYATDGRRKFGWRNGLIEVALGLRTGRYCTLEKHGGETRTYGDGKNERAPVIRIKSVLDCIFS